MNQIYSVVINHEEQYSIWPADRMAALPKGWSTVKKSGDKASCQRYIEQVWADMRPLSAKQRLAEHTRMETVIQIPR